MAGQRVKLLEKRDIATGTMAFVFEKPEGFTYEAGQACDVTLIDPAKTDDRGTTRAFSLVSIPSEPHLMFATRIGPSAFKQTIQDLQVGDEVEIDGPWGDFHLHDRLSTPAVFLIGGIGITPVRSMVHQALHDGEDRTIYVFHGNKTLENAPLFDEMESNRDSSPNYTHISVMDSDDAWDGAKHAERGFITEEIIKKYLGDDLDGSIYYLCGPRGMVSAMRELLHDAGVSRDDIRTEEFDGYQ